MIKKPLTLRLVARMVFGIVLVGAVTSAMAVPASAETTPAVELPDVQLDPATYSGPLVVATEQGDILVDINPGEATAFTDRRDGNIGSLSPEATAIIEDGELIPRGPCGTWINGVAGPGFYAESIDGCAVVGYPGYVRYMSWANGSDVMVCTQGRGWGSNGAVWYTLSCGGGTADVRVPWGNSFAYTKARAMSVSGVTGAAYIWQ